MKFEHKFRKWSAILLTEGSDEELDTLVGDGVVAPLPVEHFLEVALGLKRLNDHHDLKVGNFSDVLMLWQVSVLSYDDNAFLHQVLVNSSLFFSAHKHHASRFDDNDIQ